MCDVCVANPNTDIYDGDSLTNTFPNLRRCLWANLHLSFNNIYPQYNGDMSWHFQGHIGYKYWVWVEQGLFELQEEILLLRSPLFGSSIQHLKIDLAELGINMLPAIIRIFCDCINRRTLTPGHCLSNFPMIHNHWVAIEWKCKTDISCSVKNSPT